MFLKFKAFMPAKTRWATITTINLHLLFLFKLKKKDSNKTKRKKSKTPKWKSPSDKRLVLVGNLSCTKKSVQLLVLMSSLCEVQTLKRVDVV